MQKLDGLSQVWKTLPASLGVRIERRIKKSEPLHSVQLTSHSCYLFLLITVSFVSNQLREVAGGSNRAIRLPWRSADQKTKIFDEINSLTLQ
ncbi:hypothetical protein Oscil6304_3573 [Oscillatoria acuminata PCC 6304]|uniref:Uncharacterized protein n=1 Tax=Oscillatoria acuminata PCC 6304 TaxID=56110 RepID=K9TLU7_9CYAN|nr:hypothetical protein Oscil6304_3573 [Oscillatoria acuminata PCC 6304]